VRARGAAPEGADLLADLAARCGARFDRARWLEYLATEDAALARIERGGEVEPSAPNQVEPSAPNQVEPSAPNQVEPAATKAGL
jgi:hypothetical protein